MSKKSEIEVYSDAEGAVILGDEDAVDEFLKQNKLTSLMTDLSSADVKQFLNFGSSMAQKAAEHNAKSGKYLKLTSDSAAHLKKVGGLMETGVKGEAYAMAGKAGEGSLRWLKIDTRTASQLANPKLLMGAAGLLFAISQQLEAEEMRKFMNSVDGKLDDVRRSQRNTIIARMKTAAAQIEEAKALRKSGGASQTLWDKAHSAHEKILNVQEETLLGLEGLSEKLENEKRPGKKMRENISEIEQDMMMHLAVLARCFELEDDFRIIELDHVSTTAPENFDAHRKELANQKNLRKEKIFAKTQRIMDQLQRVGSVVRENIVPHPIVPEAILASVNNTAQAVEDFHKPLGIDVERKDIDSVPWHKAILDPEQSVWRVPLAVKDQALVAGEQMFSIGEDAKWMLIKKQRELRNKFRKK